MDRTSRRRLLVTVIVVAVAFAAGVVALVVTQGAYYRQVAELSGSGLDGETVKVGGRVVEGSIETAGTRQRFTMSDLTGEPDTVEVAFEGIAPETFGPSTDVVVLGEYDESAGLIRADELQTRCPSKYEASRSPTPSPAPSR